MGPLTFQWKQEKKEHESVPNVLKAALKMGFKTNEWNGLI